jgi:CheY-like chemotaxis protein
MGATSSVLSRKNEGSPVAKSPHDEALSFRGKCGALKIIVATDGSRRALMKFLERQRLEAYLNFYFEVEFLKTTNKEDVCQKANEIKQRFDPSVYKAQNQEPPQAVKKVWGYLDEDLATGFESAKNTAAKDPVEVLKLYKTWQSQTFDILSGYLNEFLESKEYKEWDEEQHAIDKNTAVKKQNEAKIKAEQRASMMPQVASVSPYLPTVLLVDDSNVTAKVSTKLLEKNGHKVYTAFHGRDALDLLKSVYIDVIVIDLFMPIMDGFEAISLFRSYEKEAPTKGSGEDAEAEAEAGGGVGGVGGATMNTRTLIVGMSADGSEGTLKKCLDSGADYFIAKPFTVPKFNQTLMQYIQTHKMPIKKSASIDINSKSEELGSAADKAKDSLISASTEVKPVGVGMPSKSVEEADAVGKSNLPGQLSSAMPPAENKGTDATQRCEDDVEVPAEAS